MPKESHLLGEKAQTSLLTPPDLTGPFYPLLKPPDQDADLTTIHGKSGHPQGQVIYLMGQVLNLQGKPVKGARVEIWQANTYGRYNHPSDPNPAPLDPNFEGFGVQITDAEGRYRFKTIKPGAYPTGIGDWWRPPHIHFDITGHTDRLVTQMYFAGEPLNEKDKLYNGLIFNKESVTVKLQPPSQEIEPDSLVTVFNIVLITG